MKSTTAITSIAKTFSATKCAMRCLPGICLLLALIGCSLSARAGTITFKGAQTWGTSGNAEVGWFISGSSLAYLDFRITDAATYDFDVTPGSYTSPSNRVFDVYARIYTPNANTGNGVYSPGWFPDSIYLDPGNYTMVLSYGRFLSDDATELGYNSSHEFGPLATPFQDIPFELSITGPGVSVPEPGAVTLMLSALLAMIYRRRRNAVK